MTRVLFVSNGHGEEAISARIAAALAQIAPVRSDHLALVGAFGHPSVMHDVGPRRAMPSGGLIAMGNVRNIARDVGAGLIGHTLAQLRFLRSVRGSYDAVVAVGDVFALLMALQARAKTVYLGTAKSVHVAPYGPLEERVLRRADVVLTRDPATAQRLRERGVPAQAPGNVIADLDSGEDGAAMDRAAAGFSPAIGLFPGSRPGSAYADAVALCGVVRAIGAGLPAIGGLLSIAPGLDATRFRNDLAADGWRVHACDDADVPFVGSIGDRVIIRAWRGGIGPLIARSIIVMGQAGTANEAAAAGGVPVVALGRPNEKKDAWYRKRQAGLLGEALYVTPAGLSDAAREVRALLDDAPRRARMGAIGRERMGPPGGAAAVAQKIADVARASSAAR